MDPPVDSNRRDVPEHHFVRADEIDQTGTDITAVPDEQLMPGLVSDLKPARRTQEEEDDSLLPQRHVQPPPRPDMRRDSVPPPPMQPPPPAPVPQNTDLPQDSLSLSQLRKIVNELPKAEQPVYAFGYADCQPFPEELDEWFRYSEPDRLMLLGSKETFEHTWTSFNQALQDQGSQEVSWVDADDQTRKSFLEGMITCCDNSDLFTRVEALENVCYILTGVWGITAGRAADDYLSDPSDVEAAETPKEISLQIKWIVDNVLLLQRCGGISALIGYMGRVFEKDQIFTQDDLKMFENENGSAAYFATRDREVNLILTSLYMVIEVARRQEAMEQGEASLKKEIAALKPNLLAMLVEVVARLRWDDASVLPLTRIILLFWKSVLLLFGGTKDLERAKTDLEPKYDAGEENNSKSPGMPVLTASPLDYHQFRQEITSKYPAYNPPPPLVPFESDHSSILPPLPTHSRRVNTTSTLFSGIGSSSTNNSSIIHQPVHIATPAPSPPPSPIGPGGKAGKKQNYQTNQHFPFMYPPLDGSSNDIGGSGSGVLQDDLVGRKWRGADVPASIIEAGTLFSRRMRMTRAIRQLWEERERFMKYDRGWEEKEPNDPRIDDDGVNDNQNASTRLPTRPKETENVDVQSRLDAVEEFYVHALPHLQSFVIVLLKEVLTNITALAAQANIEEENRASESALNGQQPTPAANNHEPENREKIEDLDRTRLREIRFKSISGSLLLLQKWFKRSHILKFEYLNQLLLDSNYVPLTLKMFLHQDIDRAVAQKNDRDDMSFFHFCHTHSDQPPEIMSSPEPEEVESEDEAAPPPILRQSRSQVSILESAATTSSPSPEEEDGRRQGNSKMSQLPEVDELGFPTALLPDGPITTYSFRNFFSAINFLHIMQKITRGKAHRCLLLVQYKCSAVLRKGLKIPDPHLRLYTLKLFKSQVPYCGRKWRLNHMRVITAIYLYCRPELRDDWLVGSDVDTEVEESLPMEQALRGLTHWWHLRKYKDSMAIAQNESLIEAERDFFTRELEKISLGYGEDAVHDERGRGQEEEEDEESPDPMQYPFNLWYQ